MSMILRIEYDVTSCKDCPLLGRDGVNYTCRLICSKHLDFLMLDQKRDKECPLVDVESRPTGVWVGIDEEPHEEWECSNCGNIINTYMQVELEEHEYCHKCGAKMSMPWADVRGEE